MGGAPWPGCGRRETAWRRRVAAAGATGRRRFGTPAPAGPIPREAGGPGQAVVTSTRRGGGGGAGGRDGCRRLGRRYLRAAAAAAAPQRRVWWARPGGAAPGGVCRAATAAAGRWRPRVPTIWTATPACPQQRRGDLGSATQNPLTRWPRRALTGGGARQTAGGERAARAPAPPPSTPAHQQVGTQARAADHRVSVIASPATSTLRAGRGGLQSPSQT